MKRPSLIDLEGLTMEKRIAFALLLLVFLVLVSKGLS